MMRIACFARLVKGLGFLVVFIALVRCATIGTFFTDWLLASQVFFTRDVEAENVALVTHSVMAARHISEAEGKMVYGWALTHFGDACDGAMTFRLAVVGYVLYILAGVVVRRVDKSAAATDVCERTWALVAILILVPLFSQCAWPRRYHSSDKTVARCREIAPPQNLDSNVKALVDIILEKEARR